MVSLLGNAPRYSDYQSDILLLNYREKNGASGETQTRKGFLHTRLQIRADNQFRSHWQKIRVAGLEPTVSSLATKRITNYAIPANNKSHCLIVTSTHKSFQGGSFSVSGTPSNKPLKLKTRLRRVRLIKKYFRSQLHVQRPCTGNTTGREYIKSNMCC